MRFTVLTALLLSLVSAPAYAVTMTWNANTEPDMARYNLYACPTAPATCANKVATIQHPTITWTGPDPAATTHYSLTAVDKSDNESLRSSTVTKTIVVTPDTTAPAAPGGFTVATSLSPWSDSFGVWRRDETCRVSLNGVQVLSNGVPVHASGFRLSGGKVQLQGSGSGCTPDVSGAWYSYTGTSFIRVP